jgi:hypothetical protein
LCNIQYTNREFENGLKTSPLCAILKSIFTGVTSSSNFSNNNNNIINNNNTNNYNNNNNNNDEFLLANSNNNSNYYSNNNSNNNSNNTTTTSDDQLYETIAKNVNDFVLTSTGVKPCDVFVLAFYTLQVFFFFL